MKLSKRLHQRILFRNLVITLILLTLAGLFAWLSTRYTAEMDWTDDASNTLSEASRKLLEKMPDDIVITAYVEATPLFRRKTEQVVDRYRQYKKNITVDFVNPESAPERMREMNIGKQGAMVISYQWRSEKLMVFNEATITSALLRLANADQRWITFLTGHGERSPYGSENHDLELFKKELQNLNIKVEQINLAKIAAIPDNSSLLVIASPMASLLPPEITVISDYLNRGGNLLWLTDPTSEPIPELEQIMGIRTLPGTLVDASSQLYGLNDPSFVVSSKYPPNPLTLDFQTTTVFPVTAALEMDQNSGFLITPLLVSTKSSWTETGPVSGTIRFDPDGHERQGPLNYGLTLTRDFGKSQQRIVVIGDGDFLANAYLGNVGNLELGIKLINWLSHDDTMLDIPVKTATDNSLELTKIQMTVIAFGFMIILPMLLFLTGILIWHKRKSL